MLIRSNIRSFVSLAALLLAACASAPTERDAASSASSAASPGPSFIQRSLRDGEIVVGAQPGVEDFGALREAGIRHVVNLRGAEEMAVLGFDEPAAAAAAGLQYTAVPVVGNAGYTPAVLAAFAQAMEAADGKLLLHCASGNRAGLLYAAWLVRYRGRTPGEAMRVVAPLGLWPLPMERLLGTPLSLEFADPTTLDSFETRN